jgi:hypothetical protein
MAGELPPSRILSGDFHMASKKTHFSGLFRDSCLRSAFGLAIVSGGASISHWQLGVMGSRPASPKPGPAPILSEWKDKSGG